MENLTLKMLQYKRWANEITFTALSETSTFELTKQRPTNFGNILHTLNHVYVVDDIFKHHLLGKKHGYTSRNTPFTPTLIELKAQQSQMDEWYIDYISNLTSDRLETPVSFVFVDGGKGTMTIAEIIMHCVNHGTYHRGLVSDMMYQIPIRPPANDLSVFLTL